MSHNATPANSATRRTRAVGIVVVVTIVIAALAVIATRWTALPWVSDDAGFEAPVDLATDLEVPWGLTFLPDGRALVGERPSGDVSAIAADGDLEPMGTVPGVADDGEGGLLGLVVSPEFAKDRSVYAYVTTNADNRVVRMRLTKDGLIDVEDVLTGIPKNSFHDGGRLLFGPDGMLYVTTGDAGAPELAQDKTSLAGKILRITPDGDSPIDNPFPKSPVWSYGHRNVQGLAFDDSGRLWATEFGASTYDELNLIEAGANYGWPEVEGVGGDISVTNGFVDPQVTWPTSEASPSGLAWHDGVLYMGALRGERLWMVPVNGDTAQDPKSALDGELGRIRTVMVAPDGTLWLTTSNTDGRGDPLDGDDRVVSVSVS